MPPNPALKNTRGYSFGATPGQVRFVGRNETIDGWLTPDRMSEVGLDVGPNEPILVLGLVDETDEDGSGEPPIDGVMCWVLTHSGLSYISGADSNGTRMLQDPSVP